MQNDPMEAQEIMLKDPICFSKGFSSLITDGTRHYLAKIVFFNDSKLFTELLIN
jgi:hypothetical protein